MGKNAFFNTFLRETEKVLYVIHQHWWALIVPLSKTLALGVIAPLSLFWLFIENTAALVAIPWLIVGIVFVVRAFLDWYYDVLLITNECIVDIDWNGFFSKTASRVDYETIEGVDYASHGILSTFLKFGDIEVQLHSGDTISIAYAAQAREMQRMILERRDAYADADGSEYDVETLKRALKSLMGDEMVKRKHGIGVPEDEYDEYEDEFAEDEREDTELPGDSEVAKEQSVIVMETKEIRTSKKQTGFTDKKITGKDRKANKGKDAAPSPGKARKRGKKG